MMVLSNESHLRMMDAKIFQSTIGPKDHPNLPLLLQGFCNTSTTATTKNSSNNNNNNKKSNKNKNKNNNNISILKHLSLNIFPLLRTLSKRPTSTKRKQQKSPGFSGCHEKPQPKPGNPVEPARSLSRLTSPLLLHRRHPSRSLPPQHRRMVKCHVTR